MIDEHKLFTNQVISLGRRINGHHGLGARARRSFVSVGILAYEPALTWVTVETGSQSGLVERVTCCHPRLGAVEVVIVPEMVGEAA